MTKAEFMLKAFKIMAIAMEISADIGTDYRHGNVTRGKPEVVVEYDGRCPEIRVFVFEKGWATGVSPDYSKEACFANGYKGTLISRPEELDEIIAYLENLQAEVKAHDRD